jgi:uncharacterized protein with FMN-binding domain
MIRVLGSFDQSRTANYLTTLLAHCLWYLVYYNKMHMTFQDNTTKYTAALGVVVVTVAIVGTVVIFYDSYAHSSRLVGSSASGANSNVRTSVYSDGTYTAAVNYSSPGGNEEIKVSIILQKDVVISATVNAEASDALSKNYQDRFIAVYKGYVIGKKINTIKLSAVSGSSLTSKGFNEALQQIEKQAQA